MAKKIKFTIGTKKYTLEYNRESIKEMEYGGLSVLSAESKPITFTLGAFRYAFIMHHPELSDEEIEGIYKNFKNKDELIKVLSEMIGETVESLMEEPDEKNAIMWEIN